MQIKKLLPVLSIVNVLFFLSALFVYAETTEEYLARVGGKIENAATNADSGTADIKKVSDGAASGVKNESPVSEIQASAERNAYDLKNNPDFIEKYKDLQNKITATIEDLSKAIELNPNDVEAHCKRGLAYINRSNGTFLLSGNTEAVADINKAVADYTKAIGLKPDYADAYSWRAGAYFTYSSIPGQQPDSLQSYFAKGIEDYTKAIELNPGNAAAYVSRALGYYLMEDYDNAWKDVHKAEQLGAPVPAGFLANLKKHSGRNN